jgi:thiosulfate dehydrogenase
LKRFVVGVILGAVAVPLLVYFYFTSGSAPVAASSPAMPFEKVLAHKALNARLDREMPKSIPISGDEAALLAGAQVYREQCSVCHSLPGHADTAIAAGMYPRPPKLLEGKGVTDDPPAESYWKVANGIRLTGMPGFRQGLSDTQMWQVSLLVAQADKLPKSVTDSLTASAPEEVKPAAHSKTTR